MQSQLEAFRPSIFPISEPWVSYPGTILRIPLGQVPDLDHDISFLDMHASLNQFIYDKLAVATLFASYISRIAFKELHPDGTVTKLASCAIKRHAPDPVVGEALFKSSIRLVKTRMGDCKTEERWKVIELAEDLREECARVISEEIGVDVHAWLEREGLNPRVRVAIPIPPPLQRGRLFKTFALPVSTQFPFHMDAPFALAADNQRLRDPGEVVESESLDE